MHARKIADIADITAHVGSVSSQLNSFVAANLTAPEDTMCKLMFPIRD